MSNPGDADSTPITSLQQLADYFAAGCKPAEQFRIGTEHEKFGFRLADLAAPPYQPTDGQPGSIRGLLEGLQSQFGGVPITDAVSIIGLKQGDAAISLEPAGQLELSGAPLKTLHDTAAELEAHYDQVRTISRELQIGFVPLGFHPTARREQMPWMPKGRYAIMRRYMPQVGTLGLDMMTRTCTVQVNLDYASEEDMVRKLRVSLLLQPVATALFANSPFTEGRPNGYVSYRAHCWTDTDNQRSGIPQVMFEPGFGFERYAEWLVNEVPMYFVYRDGQYIDVAGASFRDFMAGKLKALPGVRPTLDDWADHLTTLFPDVRLKRYLEMRGADAGSFRALAALPAFWTGILYDPGALDEALALIADWTEEERQALRDQVPRLGLSTPFRGLTLRNVARDAVNLALEGLRRRARLNRKGEDERTALDPLVETIETERSPADRLLADYHGPWHGDIDKVFETQAF